jgi:CcmD family protein
MSELTWMFIAFSAVWIGIGTYVLTLGIRQRKLESRLEELDRKD